MKQGEYLLECLLPTIVEYPLDSDKVVQPAKEKPVAGAFGDGIELLLDQQPRLYTALTFLRVVQYSGGVQHRASCRAGTQQLRLCANAPIGVGFNAEWHEVFQDVSSTSRSSVQQRTQALFKARS